MERRTALVVAGELRIDEPGRRATVGPHVLGLTAKEFDILLLLARHPGWVWGQEQILDEVWGSSSFIDRRVVTVHVANLRAKLRQSGADTPSIETVRGAGYRLCVTPVAVERSTPPTPVAESLHQPEHPSAAPAHSVPFVGRAAELTALNAAFASMLDDQQGGAVVLCGEPGIGKTRLAHEWSCRLPPADVHIVRACCRSNAPPFHPWTEILRSLYEKVECTAEDDVAGRLAGLIEPGAPGEPAALSVRPPHSDDASQARFRLFSGVSEFLRVATRGRPAVVFMDDLSQANDATLGLLEFLGQELCEMRLLLVLGVRDGHLDRHAALSRAVGALQRLPGAQWLELQGLTADEAAACARQLLGSLVSPEFLDILYRETDGNPLYFTEMIRSLQAGLAWRAGDSVVPMKDNRLRLVVKQRFVGLSADCNALLEAAAILGEEWSLSLLSAVVDDSPARCLELIDEAVGAGVTIPVGEHRFRFRHALFREVLCDEMGAARKARLHAAAARALERSLGGKAEDRLGELAHHFLAGWPTSGWEKAASYSVAAGQQAVQRLAWEDAVNYFGRARDVLEQAQGPPSRFVGLEVYEGLAGALELTGAYAEAEESLLAALSLGPEDSATRSRLWAKMGRIRVGGRKLAEALEAFDKAEQEFDADLDPSSPNWSPWMAIQMERAWAYYYRGDMSALGELLDRVRGPIERFGTPSEQAWLYAHLCTSAMLRDRHRVTDETLVYFERHADIVRNSGAPELLGYAEEGIGMARMLRGELDEAEAHFVRGIALARHAGDKAHAVEMLSGRTVVARLRGDREAVRRHAGELAEWAAEGDWSEHLAVARANLAWVAWKTGDDQAATDLAGAATVGWQAFTAFPFGWLAHLVLLAVAVDRGRTAAAMLSAREMLRENQQYLEPSVMESLGLAEERWEAGAVADADRVLREAVVRSRRHGYL